MVLKVLDEEFSVCKLETLPEIDPGQPFVFTAVTDEERSLVCPTRFVPQQTLRRSDGWKAFRVEGILDFSLVGILAGISEILAGGGIGIFAVSTFNTDYILTRAEDFEKAVRLLSSSGYIIAD